MREFSKIILLVVTLTATGVWPQNTIPTVRTCYDNAISFDDTARCVVNFPLGPVERKACTCFISWNATNPNVTTTTVRVTLVSTIRVTGATCNTRLQVFDPFDAYRILCSYPTGSFQDIPIREYRKRISFIQEGGHMTMTFELQDPGQVTIDCEGIPLPDTTPSTQTTAPTSAATPSTVAPSQSTRAPTQSTTAATQPTPTTTQSTSAQSQSTAVPTQSTAAPSQSTAASTQSTATTKSTAATTQPTQASTQSTAAINKSTAATTKSSANTIKSTAATTKTTQWTTTTTPNQRMTTTRKTSPETTTRVSCPIHGTTAPTPEKLEFLKFLEAFKLMKMKICLCKFLKKEFSEYNYKDHIGESQTFHMEQKSQQKKQKAWNSAIFTHLWFAKKKKYSDGEQLHWNH